MNKWLAEALAEISEKHIAEAANAKKKHHTLRRCVAAALVVVMLMNMPFIPGIVSAKTVAEASDSRVGKRPSYQNKTAYNAWSDAVDVREANADAAVATLNTFFKDTAASYMTGTKENRVWSPVNAYIALAMLAEITDGNSRQQILDVLNTPDIETLRNHVSGVWESVYTDDGNEISRLANSLWLDEDITYDQQTMDNVAYYHYADIYQTDLSSKRAGKALRTWLNNNTGGLLKNNVSNASFPPLAVVTLASTVYLQSKWVDEFSAVNNTVDVFHTPNGDVDVTYMHKKEYHMNYYWGDSFGAVNLDLSNGTAMWFFLPDEGKTVDDVLSEGQYMDYLTLSWAPETECSKYMKVNLSVPKFDIASSADLREMLQSMGVTDIFNEEFSDFTAITSDTPVYVTAVNQAARVIIDEQGVKAASYIEIPGAGAAMPPEEIIDFVLDRPFLFVIADSNGIPLFTGVVNKP